MAFVVAGISAAAAVASALTSGASVAANLAGTPEFGVFCKFEIENWTKYPLLDPECDINGGMVKSPPVAVQPGEKESFVGHKTGHTATGTSGTASWLIEGQNKRAVIMWSCPYDFNLYSNWLGVGLTTYGNQKHGENWFQQMYNEQSIDRLNFDLEEYYHNTKTVSMKDGNIEITGIMGTSHKATARIIVRPLLKSDMAPSIKAKVDPAILG